MAYSCGIFERPDSTLEEAALAKYDRICRKLELGPDDHVLEIGCGWGGLAIYAARRFGCRVTGMMLLQAITIADRSYEAYRRSVDFIQRYVFPGGLLPSVEAICRSVTRSTDFRLFHLEDITPHYAMTLAHWRRRFHENLSEIRQLGLPEDLLRIWEFYFCYCEGGFRERVIGDVQMLLTRPECRREPILPRLSS